MVAILILALFTVAHFAKAFVDDAVILSDFNDEISVSLLQLKAGFRIRNDNYGQANGAQEVRSDKPILNESHTSLHDSAVQPPGASKVQPSMSVKVVENRSSQIVARVLDSQEQEARAKLSVRAEALRDVEALQEVLLAAEPTMASSASGGFTAMPMGDTSNISRSATPLSVFAAARGVAQAGLAMLAAPLESRAAKRWTPHVAMSLLGEGLRLQEGPRGALMPILAIIFLMLVALALVASADGGTGQHKPLAPRWAAQSSPLASSTALPSSSVVQQSFGTSARPSVQFFGHGSSGMPRPSSGRPSLAPASTLPRLPPASQQALTRPAMTQPPAGPAVAQQPPRGQSTRPGTVQQRAPALQQAEADQVAPPGCVVSQVPHLARMPTAGCPPELQSPHGTLPRLNLESLSQRSEPSRPAVLCPSLIMPHCETWLAVSVEKLLEGEGVTHVFGISGTPLLQVAMRRAQGSHFMDFAMAPARSPTLGTLVAGPCAEALELRGPDGQRLGELRCCGSGVHVLTIGDREALTLVQDVQSRMLLYAPGSTRPAAEASRERRPDLLAGAELLTVRVEPGEDAVLALACVVAALLHGSRASIASSVASSSRLAPRALRPQV